MKTLSTSSPIPRLGARATSLALVGASLLSAGAAAMPVPPRVSDGVAVPSQPLAAGDDASAIYVNPANLAFLPGPEARFTLVHTGQASTVPNRGFAVDLALPLWILATGLRIDVMNPPDSAPAPVVLPGDARPYSWVRWGTAIRLGEMGSIGTTLGWSNAKSARLHGLFSVATGLTLRPLRFLSAAAVIRDWNTPDNRPGSGGTGTRQQPSLDLGLSLRPLMGRRLLEIGGEASYRGDAEDWAVGANLAVEVPYVGRLRAGATLLDGFDSPNIVASAGLEVNLKNLQVVGGPVFGASAGRPGVTPGGTGFYAGAAIRGFRERPGIPTVKRVVRLRLESTPGVRAHVQTLRTLWRLADDPEVEGLLLVLRASPTDSLAHAEELVDAIELLRSRGKKVLCHLEDAGGRELYVCSAADRIAINPAGGLRFAGISSRRFYLGGLLKKLGVRADFVRIGSHKLAPEQFLGGPSDVGRGDHRELVDAIERVYLDRLAKGRRMTRLGAKRTIAKGPFIATEARDLKLVDELVYEDEIDRFAEEAFGHRVRIVDLEPEERAPRHWRSPPKIAVVYLHGDMIDGHSRTIPLVGIRLAGSYTIAQALKQAREDKSIKAVVFRIETGGGSSLASDVILREATLLAKQKPLVVSMGTSAASGGYYAGVAARDIFANRATVTGSIGIFYGKVDVAGLLGKLGVTTEAARSAPHADAESIYRPFSDEERAMLGVKVKQFYDLFVGRVAVGRKMTPAAVHAVAQGKVWTGEQAKQKGLVDRVGGLRQALARAAELGSLPPDAPIVQLPVEPSGLLGMLLQLAGAKATLPAASDWVPPPLVDIARALVPLTVYDSHKPLARMEILVTGP